MLQIVPTSLAAPSAQHQSTKGGAAFPQTDRELQKLQEHKTKQNKTKVIEFWCLLSEICWRTNPEEETYLPPLLCISHPSIFRSMLCFRLTQSQACLQVGITNNRSTNNKHADLANIFCFTSYDFVFFFWASHCFTSTAIKSLSVL